MASDLNTQFPDRAACFGLSGFTNTTCTVPTPEMINFLNISNVWNYKQAYCLNPPQDSCAFGYCPNPDIARPAVRVSSESYVQIFRRTRIHEDAFAQRTSAMSASPR